MNIERMRAVRQDILDRPNEFDMSVFVSVIDDEAVGCIAGFAATKALGKRLIDLNHIWPEIPPAAQQWLGLTHREGETLFHTSHWEIEFREAYRRDDATKEQRAWAAAGQIEHMIAAEEERVRQIPLDSVPEGDKLPVEETKATAEPVALMTR